MVDVPSMNCRIQENDQDFRFETKGSERERVLFRGDSLQFKQIEYITLHEQRRRRAKFIALSNESASKSVRYRVCRLCNNIKVGILLWARSLCL